MSNETATIQPYNVIADTLVSSSLNQTQKGCYQLPDASSSVTDFSIINGLTKSCKTYAVNNGLPYYGQDAKGNCYAGKSLDGLIDASREIITLWTSGGDSGTIVTLTHTGIFTLKDSSGKTLWKSADNIPIDKCIAGGHIQDVNASYGANCVGKPVGIDCDGNVDQSNTYAAADILGNLTDSLTAAIVGKKTVGYAPLSDWNDREDPAFCCAKTTDYSYRCGGGPVKSGKVNGGETVSFDCAEEVNACTFVAQISDDGNCVLILSTDEKTPLWSTQTAGKALESYPAWRQEKGKWGKSQIRSGDSLAIGEWIGSKTGTVRLILDASGALMLQTSKAAGASCPKGIAPFQLDNTGRPVFFGEIGLLNPTTGTIQSYNTKKWKHSDTDPYSSLAYTSIDKHNLSQVSGGNPVDCEVACNTTKDCSGFTWMEDAQTCFLKKAVHGTTTRVPSVQAVSGIRGFVVTNDLSCARTAKPRSISTNDFDKGVAVDPSLTPFTKCPGLSVPLIPPPLRKMWEKADKGLDQRTQMSLDNIQRLETVADKQGVQIRKNETRFQKYKHTLDGKKSLPFVEGMQVLNSFDMKRKEEDSLLVQNQSELTCMLWTLLALGVATIAVKASRS